MPRFLTSIPLEVVLFLDAASCAVMGAVFALASPTVAEVTGLPADFLFYLGLGILPVAAYLAFVAALPGVNPLGVRLAVFGNLLWIAGSLLVLPSGWIAPTALGTGFVLVQAAAVALLTVLEWRGLRAAAMPRDDRSAA